ncbi:MAG: hypothetical protein QMD07_01390 [Thermodesulfovibrionales bacterium]|nr:hypothetical protein [Thermodesulfovibrionales bacterium]
MKVKNSKLKIQSYGIIFLLLCCSAALLFFFSLQSSAFSAEKWQGVDELVVEKFAKEHGREAREPFINTDQGDLLLFVFLIAGAAGGFIAGYYWRILMVERAPKISREEQKIKG